MIEFFNSILEWFSSGIYDFLVEAYSWIIIKVTTFKFSFMLLTIEFSWDIAKEILTQLNISQEMESALTSLPSDVVQKLNFFNITNGINLLLNAFVTRFVMRFTGL